MDPPIISETSFTAANPSSYSLSEIWPFPISGGGGTGVLGLRMSGFGDAAANRDEESTVTEQSGGAKRRRDANSEDESSKLVSTSSGNNDLNDSSRIRMKASDSVSKAEVEASSGSGSKLVEQSGKSSEPPKDYIHVRARRGQATDSHSLAERARREKISERMKILQDLVPGCNKVLYAGGVLYYLLPVYYANPVSLIALRFYFRYSYVIVDISKKCSHFNQVIGKALVLDEIINYIQSLQHQVEFLSMKLEAVNSRIEPTMEGFPTKNPLFIRSKMDLRHFQRDSMIFCILLTVLGTKSLNTDDVLLQLGAPTFDAAGMIFGSQAQREYAQGSHPDWLHMQLGLDAINNIGKANYSSKVKDFATKEKQVTNNTSNAKLNITQAHTYVSEYSNGKIPSSDRRAGSMDLRSLRTLDRRARLTLNVASRSVNPEPGAWLVMVERGA
ncbi:hypothetical protein RJ640_005334 [Escallonia rubra]|uniref:BHLH domain-containing protein n=1 Tax=Escallonia rubra TaxID=112253 RepID=A0AA88QGA7_9ASTE|nr:hypothetical protein RJ640_005334 [Escallonia rubra]